MGVTELPASLTMLCESGKVSRCCGARASGVDLNFPPRDRHYGELVGERINAQIISPLQFNLTDGVGELTSTLLCGSSCLRDDPMDLQNRDSSAGTIEYRGRTVTEAPGGAPCRNLLSPFPAS